MNANTQEVVSVLQKQTLKRYLKNSDFEFRSLGTLAKAIGEPESVTVALLNEIGAKQARSRRTGKTLFKLPA